MKRMIRIVSISVLITALIFSCSPQRRLGSDRGIAPVSAGSLHAFCDSAKPIKSLYIKGIDAKIFLDNEEYNAKLSIYYLPDSLFLVSAVNAGFEIVRMGVSHDSTVYINRLDKLVYVIRNNHDTGASPPVLFEDVERLLNRTLLCDSGEVEKRNEKTLLVDRSTQDIAKKIFYGLPGPQIDKFEFFQKKTGEYVVGEMNEGRKIIIYSNYIVDDLTLQAEGGEVEYGRILNVNLTVNSKKYTIVYL